MNTLMKITSVLGFAAVVGTAASAQTADVDTDIIGMSCGDFLAAEVADQFDYVRALKFMATGEEVISPEAAAQADTIDPDVRALAELCEGDETMMLTEIEMPEAGSY